MGQCSCGGNVGESSPGADAGGVSPVPAQMWCAGLSPWVTHSEQRLVCLVQVVCAEVMHEERPDVVAAERAPETRDLSIHSQRWGTQGT